MRRRERSFYDGGHGCLEQSALAAMVAKTTAVGMAVSTAIGLLIFLGAVGKSGQLPLHVWLPDAMEGPTPVSALIHAATMVAAGVFLVARVYPLMEATPVQSQVQPTSIVQSARPLTPALSPSEGEREKRSQRVEHSSASGLRETVTSAHPLPAGEGRGEGERVQQPATSLSGVVLQGKKLETPHVVTYHDENAAASPVSIALQVITWIGALTAIFAASIAVAQNDIKRILAYSTVSQLGYMMMGLGVGGVAVGMFHLITHAFFKALLFLGSGSVIHGCHEEQDIRHMGGLKKFMPVTFATYAVGMLALAGFPLFFSGFWSKDEILHAAHGWPVSQVPFYLGCAGALLTAFYMTRQVALVFFGEYRSRRGNEAGHSATHKAPPPHVGGYDNSPHESPAVMTVPLVILAACAVLLGVIGTPMWPWFQEYLGKHHEGTVGVVPVMLVSSLIVFSGLGLGWWLYGKRQRKTAAEADVLEIARPDIFALLKNKYFVDELYEATVIRFNAWFASACDFMDRWVWGGAVLLVSGVMVGLAWLYRVTDEFVVNLGFDAGCEGIRRGGGGLSKLHTGRVQTYLRVIGVALVVLILFLVWGRKS